MKLKDAVTKRLPRIRRAIWAGNAYLRLPLMDKGLIGAWAELYDDYVQKDVLNIKPGSQKIPLLPSLVEEEDWEPYTGEPSTYEQDPDNFARTYLEK
jgi:hypothetical protein